MTNHGCCVDKSCNGSTCMQLPEGKTCGDCAHARRCVAIFGAKREDTACQFFPRRFFDAAALSPKEPSDG